MPTHLSSEQIGAGGCELHMSSGLVQLQPTPFDGELQACAFASNLLDFLTILRQKERGVSEVTLVICRQASLCFRAEYQAFAKSTEGLGRSRHDMFPLGKARQREPALARHFISRSCMAWPSLVPATSRFGETIAADAP
jgi:hypothetical protein